MLRSAGGVLLSLAAVSLVPLGGCAAPRAGARAAPALPERPREAVTIFDSGGDVRSWGETLDAVAQADVVIIGESHGHPLGLEAAACLWDDLLARRPDAALLLEFFERDEQVALDDYLSGITDETGFRKAAGRAEGNYPPGHAKMVEAAKAAGRPVIAANAPRRYVRKASPQGYDDLLRLGEEQRRLFVAPAEPVEGRYREEFFELMSGGSHGTGGEGGEIPPEMVERMYRSQLMWDATMADSVVRAALRGYTPAVLVVGRFHSDFDGGTVQMIQRARPDLDVLTLSVVPSEGPGLDDADRGRADFILYVGEDPQSGL